MIDKLEYVLALAKEQHFGRAAEACGVTQPTLSAGLKALEDALGVLIVRRSSRFLGFTPEGERVLAWARRIVGDAKAMRQDLDVMQHGLDGHVRLAVIPTALPLVVRLTAPLRSRHPGVRFTILSRASERVLQLLENLEVDVGLSYLDNEPLGHVRTIPIDEERYSLLSRRDGAFEGRASVTWAEVARLPLCLLTPDMQHRRIVDQMLRASGGAPEPTLVSDSATVLLTHVRTGHWASILPHRFIEETDRSIVATPIIEPDVRHSVGLVLPHRELSTSIVRALASEARRLALALSSR